MYIFSNDTTVHVNFSEKDDFFHTDLTNMVPNMLCEIIKPLFCKCASSFFVLFGGCLTKCLEVMTDTDYGTKMKFLKKICKFGLKYQ